MVALKMPAFNLCILAGYAEQVPELHVLKNGNEFAEFSILVPGETGSYKIYATGDLVRAVVEDLKPAEAIILFGRTTTMKSSGQICLQAVRAINHGTETDLQHLDALAIVEGFNLQIPSVGYHRV
ncbi:hypothetical protein H8Z79_15845 [Blautia sp. 2744]|uniref:Uncharacterized protein n=1 Tax=Blautia intestinalis TaxID=2763028 RepID=A0ABR7I5S5_9FIRM|nr:hypothetical protein [Blautia intestinalis]MBC5741852.1 hypothetical protein [Blautia intestinalis]RHD29407.1 hypothetical protein DW799_14855 [Blautia obeum]